MTTQTRIKRHHYGWDDGMRSRDRELHCRPRFEARHDDRTHPTRNMFAYRWRDGGQLHARPVLRRALP